MRTQQLPRMRILSVLTLLTFCSFFNFSCVDDNDVPYSIPTESFEIRELKILTQRFDETKDFWSVKLGFELVPQPIPTTNVFTVKVGNSRLTFVKMAPIMNQPDNIPQYHFSFNIPNNQAENALDWLKADSSKYANGPAISVNILEDQTDGAQIIRRDRYNAHSVFFTDPNGNIIELIARHNLENAQDGPFDNSMLLNISEVSIVTMDVKQSGQLLNENFGVREIPGTTSGFKPYGGENGMLAVVVTGRIWEPTVDFKAVPWPMEIVVRNPDSLQVLIPGTNFQPVRITTEP